MKEKCITGVSSIIFIFSELSSIIQFELINLNHVLPPVGVVLSLALALLEATK